MSFSHSDTHETWNTTQPPPPGGETEARGASLSWSEVIARWCPVPSGISPACRASVRAVGGRPVSPRMLGPSRERVRGGRWVILSTRGSSQQTRAPPLGADERGQRAQPVHTPHTPEPWLPGALRFTHTDAHRRGTCTDLPDTGARDAHSTHVCTHNTAHTRACQRHMHTYVHTRTHNTHVLTHARTTDTRAPGLAQARRPCSWPRCWAQAWLPLQPPPLSAPLLRTRC